MTGLSPLTAVSLWGATAPAAPAAAPLAEHVEAEVAVVGGGFTGCSAALHLAEAGADVALLEARDFGHGGSGRNVGLVNAGLWLPPDDIERQLDGPIATRLIEALSAGPALVFALIEKHQIRCEAVRNGSIHVAHAPAGMKDLAERSRQWERRGAAVELLDRAETARLTGTQAFHGGLLDRRAGTINPMGYVRGLARAAQNAGARLHGGSPVTALARDGARWRVTTPAGSVAARWVILGTNAYTDRLWPGLRRCITPLHFFQVASRPLGAAARRILPERQGIWDTGKVMLAVRVDAEGRLVLGSMGQLIGPDARLSRTWAGKTARRLYPELGSVDWDQAWSGRIAMTRDHLPRVFELAPRLYAPIGYNGRGIAPGTVFGKALAELIGGRPAGDLPLPLGGLAPETLPRLRSALYEAALGAYRLYKCI